MKLYINILEGLEKLKPHYKTRNKLFINYLNCKSSKRTRARSPLLSKLNLEI